VAVVVPTRDRPRYLAAMLDCLAVQTVAPTRVIVVDDSPAPETAGAGAVVEACRADFGVRLEYMASPATGRGLTGNPARNAGARRLGPLQPYLLFVDDDDRIPADYIERLLEAIEADPEAAGAYPHMRRCGTPAAGDHAGVAPWSHAWDPEQLGRTNLAPIAALLRGDAFWQVGGFFEYEGAGGRSFASAPFPSGDFEYEGAHAGLPPSVPYDDWSLWRRLRGHGWRMTPAHVIYEARKHADGESVLARLGAAAHQFAWSRTIDLAFDGVTLAIPFSGRSLLDRQLAAIDAQTFPREWLHVLAYDTSGSAPFAGRVKRWLGDREFASTRYARDWRPARPDKNQTASELADAPRADDRNGFWVNHRVAGIWNRIGQLVGTDLVWALEDDMVPPPHCLDRLLRAMTPAVDAVSACYEARLPAGRLCAWELADEGGIRHLHREPGVQAADGFGFGCCLIRRDVFRRPAKSDGGLRWYDQNLWADVRAAGGGLLVDGDLVCEHVLCSPGGRGG
jgi:hypothetical protein